MTTPDLGEDRFERGERALNDIHLPRLREAVKGCVLGPGNCRCLSSRYGLLKGIAMFSPEIVPSFVEAFDKLGDHCPSNQSL